MDRVYTLTELYIQECEKLQSIGDVKALTYAMLRDFCQRCAEAQVPSGISKEVSMASKVSESAITVPMDMT